MNIRIGDIKNKYLRRFLIILTAPLIVLGLILFTIFILVCESICFIYEEIMNYVRPVLKSIIKGWYL